MIVRDGSMASKFYPRAKMIIPDDRPMKIEHLLALFLGEHPKNARIQVGRVLLDTIRAEMPRGWPAERWPEVVLKAMGEYYPEAEEILKWYKEELIWTRKRGEIPKLLSEKARELGLVEEGERRAKGRLVDLFTIYRGHYSAVVKILREAKLIRKVEGRYQLSDEFERILEAIAEFWNYYRKGRVE
jgi:hypothetical protein